MGQRLTGMTSGQASFPVANSLFKFAQQGKSGMLALANCCRTPPPSPTTSA